MKRIGNIYEKIFDKDNLWLAHTKAQRGKAHYKEVKEVNKNPDFYIQELYSLLKEKRFKNSPYQIFNKQTGNKLRTIYKLPYYPDRIVQHAILQVLEPIWKKVFIRDTYQSIKGRGVHDAKKRIEKIIREEKPKYCLKIDVQKFYPSVDNEILKIIIRKKIKCKDTLWLLDEIIDSTQGLPIGNYISQYFGNLYLAYFDHQIKEKYAKRYYRYCDDIVILHDNKEHLHFVLKKIKEILDCDLNIQLKDNYQVFPITSRPIDFLGYRFFYTHTLVRNSIKRAFIRKALHFKRKNTEKLQRSMASYYGWLVHANAFNLLKKHIKDYENIFSKKTGAIRA